MILGTRRHEVEIDAINETYYCREDQHLLAGMASMGKRGIPSGCHGGGCGVCKVRILKGEVDTIVMSRKYVTEQEEKEGIVLACRAFPRSAVKLEVIGKISKNVLRPGPQVKKYGFV
jgi:ferredoxin